jgi:hypothetical protein
VRVRSRIRLGDREHHLAGAGGQAGQPRRALLVRAEPGDDLRRDGRRDHEQQQRGALRAEFLADQGELGEAAAPAAVLGRDVHANESSFTKLGPQLLARGVLGRVLRVVLRPEAAGYRRYGGPQVAVLLALGKIRACSIEVIANSLGL